MVEKYELSPLPGLFQGVAPDFVVPDPFGAPTLRWGILGAGSIGVGSRDIERARTFTAEHGVVSATPYGATKN